MKSLECTLISFLLGCCLPPLAGANVYAYTADDGTVNLSNVPSDDRYRVLILDQKENVVATSLVDSRKPPLTRTNKVQYNQIVEEIARVYELDGALLHAVITAESNYNPKAVSRKGAIGLMQLMPETAKRYGVADSFDAVQNLNGGAKYLRDLLKLFNSDVSLALAAYNAGENAVVKYGNRIPPIRETKDYVPKVLGFYRKYQSNL